MYFFRKIIKNMRKISKILKNKNLLKKYGTKNKIDNFEVLILSLFNDFIFEIS